MNLSDFSYELPTELIATHPNPQRSHSRLLCVNRANDTLTHSHFHHLDQLLKPGDLLVFNNTKVIPARLFAHKPTGGKVELLIERIVNNHQAYSHIKANKALKSGSRIIIDEASDTYLTVLEKNNDLYLIETSANHALMDILQQYGQVPLPPYIKRKNELEDQDRYQTVYASVPGAVAAPTAGLHFDHQLLEKLKNKKINQANVTLHVGAGTFQPVRVNKITDHTMHSEIMHIDQDTCEKIKTTKENGGRVIAVGTTSVRCLESAAQLNTQLEPYSGETSIFIYPGYEFKIVDAIITNFHLPESTLLMLISAFAGHKKIMHTYQVAVKERYRFFSYGDAMLIE